MNKKFVWWMSLIAVAVFVGGCVPEESLEWSDDGSVGLLRVKGALYLVDGQSGALTAVEEKDVQPRPGMSKDGTAIVYARQVQCADLTAGLKRLPAGQVKMIDYCAEQMRNDIVAAGGLTKGKLPDCKLPALAADDYKNWVVRRVCEKYAAEISKAIGTDDLEKECEQKISYFELVIANRNQLDQKRVIATSLLHLSGTTLSPNGKYIAYLMHSPQGKAGASDGQSLLVAAVTGETTAAMIDSLTAFGYDWRSDSRAIVYPQAEVKEASSSDFLPATIREKIVADEQGALLAKPVEPSDTGTPNTHVCIGEHKHIAGSLFSPDMRAAYGPEGHIFFASMKLQIPAGTLDEGKWSLFCYDPVTQSIFDIIPNTVAENLELNSFSLSPDGRKAILPMLRNRFGIYKVGQSSINFPIKPEEGFGDEKAMKFAPAWKSEKGISCLVSEKSHFLKDKQARRPEVIVINTQGELEMVLSTTWPDAVIENLIK
jgi:hypothetical protein